jgi:CheY-like chemotaxis protein
VTHIAASSSADELPPVQLALIIEDSATTADQLARYLEELQIQPVICSYGKGAVEQVQALRPDLILLDVQMPDRSGWEILADLRRDPDLRQVPVIIVSVVDEPERGLAAGAAAYLVKPINRLMLRRALSQITVTKTTSSTAPRRPLSRRILLAEDNEVNRVTLSDYLVAQGYEVRVACQGKEALQIAAEWRPDLIIMDIQMPGLDGLEVIQRLRADAAFAATPIIAVTALAMPGDRERCLSAGANDYFAKPIRLRQLVERIEQFLASSQHAI